MRKHLLILALLSAGLNAFCAEAAHERASVEEQILKQVNQLRVGHQLPPLKENSRLRAAALAHCRQMVQQHAIGHQFEGEPRLVARISTEGVHWETIGENVGYASFGEDLETGWEHSPPHRKNLLDARYTEVGIAVLEAGDRFYGVQDFALTTSSDAADVAEHRVAAAYNKLRVEREKPTARFISEPKIRAAMCSMAADDKVSAGAVASLGFGEHIVVFTAAEPEHLPPELTTLARGNGRSEIYVGVCHAASKTYPGGTYWVGVVY